MNEARTELIIPATYTFQQVVDTLAKNGYPAQDSYINWNYPDNGLPLFIYAYNIFAHAGMLDMAVNILHCLIRHKRSVLCITLKRQIYKHVSTI